MALGVFVVINAHPVLGPLEQLSVNVEPLAELVVAPESLGLGVGSSIAAVSGRSVETSLAAVRQSKTDSEKGEGSYGFIKEKSLRLRAK